MKSILVLALTIHFSIGFSQPILTWSPDYKLQLNDFQSPQTEINSTNTFYSIYSGANINFSFQMSTYEFMFTKNFNSKVTTSFNKNAAVISAPDTATANQLLKFGQYAYDLAELYSRKFRKELHEQKGAFSDPNYFRPIFEQLQAQMNTESARVLKITDFGKKVNLLAQEHQLVLDQIEQLSDFCQACKPPKKKK